MLLSFTINIGLLRVIFKLRPRALVDRYLARGSHSRQFVKIFVSLIDDNEIVVEASRVFFLCIPLSIGFMGMMQVANSSFNARGLPNPALVISLLRSLVVGVPLAYLGDLLWGYTGIFLATAICNVVVGLLAWYWNQQSVEKQSRHWSMAQVAKA